MTIDIHSTATAATVTPHIAAACDRIAPTWPLDQFIAVNPYWGWRSAPVPQAAAMLGALAGTRLTMPRSWFCDEWTAGRLTSEQIRAVADELGDPGLATAAEAVLENLPDHERLVVCTMSLVTDRRDLGSVPMTGQTWGEFVTHQISQHCGAHFDRWQGSWHPDQTLGLFAGWREQMSMSRGVRWRNGRSWAQRQVSLLPAEPVTAIATMLAQLKIPEAGYEAYLTSLLLSINGWAAWCAYVRWQARLTGEDDQEIVGLLAVRLAWEWLLRNDAEPSDTDSEWQHWAESWATAEDLAAEIAHEQRVDWLLQSAAERTFQATVIAGLANSAPPLVELPSVQAVFCIDVRSEVIRRALESVTAQIHTRGFAGFFGLAISYSPIGSALTRPQLPGLLSPAVNVTESTSNGTDRDAVIDERLLTLGNRQRWSRFRSAPSSVFSFVESMGLLSGPKLVTSSLPTPIGLRSGNRTVSRPKPRRDCGFAYP